MAWDTTQPVWGDNVVSFIDYIIRNDRKEGYGCGSAGQVVSFGGNNVISLAERR